MSIMERDSLIRYCYDYGCAATYNNREGALHIKGRVGSSKLKIDHLNYWRALEKVRKAVTIVG